MAESWSPYRSGADSLKTLKKLPIAKVTNI